MNTKELIEILVGKKTQPARDADCVPSYLKEKYDREGAALNLASSRENSAEVLGALAYASLLDDDEDVRIRSLEAIVELDPIIAETLLIAATYDKDERVRETALDWLFHLKKSSAQTVAERLLQDPSNFVAELARNFLNELNGKN